MGREKRAIARLVPTARAALCAIASIRSRVSGTGAGGPARRFRIVVLLLLCLALVSCDPWLYRTKKAPSIRLKIFPGTTQVRVLDGIENAPDLRDVRLEIFSVGGWHGNPEEARSNITAKAHPSGPAFLTLRIEASAEAQPRDYQGNLILRFGPGAPTLVSLVSITVVPLVDPATGARVIPTRPSYASSDRIVADEYGQRLLRDELIVLFKLETPKEALDHIPAEGPVCGSGATCFLCPPLVKPSGERLDAKTRGRLTPAEVRKMTKGGIACSIADITGGVFLGSVPEAKAYQLRFPEVKTPAELAEKRQEVLRLSEAFPELTAVSRSFIASASSIPADDYSDNAQSFNAINVNTVGGAWDKVTTTSDMIPGNPPPAAPGDPPRIPVAVIDADFRGAETHPDLLGNVGYASDTVSASGDLQHGTRVAGLIGARGNNGEGIAGIIWDVDLRLYDYRRGSPAPTAINMLEAMVRAIDNEQLCHATSPGVGCVDGNPIDNPAGLPQLHPHVINISVDFLGDPSACDEDVASENNAILGQGILYGIRQEKEILWVLAAGNQNKDAKCQAPASLTGTFPLNTMTVAATDPGGGALWNNGLMDGSNWGPFVTVAAPGESLRTLNYSITDSTYGYVTPSGTSVAAPLVSGTAALIFSQFARKPDFDLYPERYTARKVKQCIVQNATMPPSPWSHPFGVLDAGAAVPPTNPDGSIGDCQTKTIDLSKITKIDVVLSFDTTGSMSQEIGAVKIKAQEIVDAINRALGGGNPLPPQCDTSAGDPPCCDAARVCFAVVSYRDYPGRYDSTGTGCGSSYNAIYGEGSDFPFMVNQKLIENTTSVTGAISALTADHGSDLPESYARVFWEIANAVGSDGAPNPLGFLSKANRDSLKVIINFGDDVPHDTSLSGHDLPCRKEVYAACPASDECPVTDVACNRLAALRITNPPDPDYDTGVDPGRDNVPCTSYDRDFQEDALMGLIANGVRLIHIDSSEPWRAHFVPHWSVWTRATGGALGQISPDGTTSLVDGGTLDLPRFIVELLSSIPVVPPGP